MKIIYLSLLGTLLCTHISFVVAMDVASLHGERSDKLPIDTLSNINNQGVVQESVHHVDCDEENSSMSSLSCAHEDNVVLPGSSTLHDQASINAMVLGLVNRANKQDEIIRQQDRRIDDLTSRVEKNESIRTLLMSIYDSFPVVVCEIERLQKQLQERQVTGDQQVNKFKILVNKQTNDVKSYLHQYVDAVNSLTNAVDEHANRQDRLELFSKKLRDVVVGQLESNQLRAKNELRLYAKNIKSLASVDFKSKGSSSNHQSSVNTLHEQNQDFDYSLDADFDFDNLEKLRFIFSVNSSCAGTSVDSDVSANTSCASTSINSELPRLRSKRARDNSADANPSSNKKN